MTLALVCGEEVEFEVVAFVLAQLEIKESLHFHAIRALTTPSQFIPRDFRLLRRRPCVWTRFSQLLEFAILFVLQLNNIARLRHLLTPTFLLFDSSFDYEVEIGVPGQVPVKRRFTAEC